MQRPFYPEGEVCHLYLVHPPGGIVSGDQVTLELRAQAGAHAVLTTPAATKFYRARNEAPARLVQNLSVRDAALEWLPQETLVFDGAQARASTRVDLASGARFIGWEVLCLGRPASNEPFLRGRIHQDFELRRDGVPLLLDRLRVTPGTAQTAAWGLSGHEALGTLMATPATRDDADAVLALDDAAVSCTLVDGVLLVRTLAAQGELVRRRLQRVWQVLRPRLLGRPALSPRIWST
ncbi:MAG: urease accessory protein UreD [Steroidobacteraceae bacterium]